MPIPKTAQPVEKVTYSLSFFRKTALLAQGSKLRNAFVTITRRTYGKMNVVIGTNEGESLLFSKKDA